MVASQVLPLCFRDSVPQWLASGHTHQPDQRLSPGIHLSLFSQTRDNQHGHGGQCVFWGVRSGRVSQQSAALPTEVPSRLSGTLDHNLLAELFAFKLILASKLWPTGIC